MRRAVVLLALAACGDNSPGADISIVVTPDAWSFAITELATLTPGATISILPPEQAIESNDSRLHLAVVDDPAIPLEGFRLDEIDATSWRVSAHDILGAQYGTAAALENLGIRYRHPFDPEVPGALAFAPTTPLGTVQQPEIRVRGLQLHTLHPIESYYAFWEPSPGNKNDAHRVIDWVIKNRGNFLQWVALDDINDPKYGDPWKLYTRELIDYAHARGIRVGLNIQLYGQANLQLAFDLSDDTTGTVPIHDEIAARLPTVTKDTPFDVYALSFGEFFNADPATFIAAVDEVHDQLAALAPQAEMHAVVHVGATQRVDYMGENLIYYFLVKFANAAIVPDIHTVMFYNLFEDAGLAYHQENFDEHRAYLEDRMCAKKPAAYFPETAYWVAFDNSVPQWDPLYVRSRWLDLHELKARNCWPLDEHLIFSSGWEWGFWINDAFSLRASYTIPDTIDPLLDTLLPAGTLPMVDSVITAQHDSQIGKRLTQYLAGRDIAIDTGDESTTPIVSQPDRITFADLVAGSDPVSFRATVLDPLGTYAQQLDAIALPVATDRWTSELADGLAVDRLRAHFMLELYDATLAHLAGDATEAQRAYDAATAYLDDATAVVQHRHVNLHATALASSGSQPGLKRRLLDDQGDADSNHTFYQYGYLRNADTLCFWQRELIQVGGILGNSTLPVPGCLFKGNR